MVTWIQPFVNPPLLYPPIAVLGRQQENLNVVFVDLYWMVAIIVIFCSDQVVK